MKTYNEIRKEQESKVTQLIDDSKMFFAFSNKQLEEGMLKTPLQEGDKYLSLGAGCYLPKSKLQTWIDGTKNINEWQRNEVKNAKLEQQEILFELENYECFYTGSISDAVDKLSEKYTEKQILDVFKKYRKQYNESY